MWSSHITENFSAGESISQIGVITGITLVTTTSTQEGVDFYAIMADSSKQNFLVHIQY